MSFPKVLFYVFVLLTCLVLVSVVNSLAGRRRKAAWTTIRLYLILASIYGTFLVATTLALPLQVLTTNETQYDGDWAVSVASLRRMPHDLDEDYEIDFRLTNRGAKPITGDKNLVAYLVGEDGTRYNAASEPSTPPFDVALNPGKFAITTRKYVLPQNLNRVELVIAKQGFRLGWFMIGRTPFDGRTVIQLQ